MQAPTPAVTLWSLRIPDFERTTWVILFIMVVKHLLYYLTSPPELILSVCPLPFCALILKIACFGYLYHLLFPPTTDLL